MPDITIEAPMPGPPGWASCVNVDCPVMMFDERNQICPGCWEKATFVVEELKYSLRRKS